MASIQANKGVSFEQLIDYVNMQYRTEDVALVQKIATPWKVVRAYDYATGKSKIVNAFPEKKSTVDFVGVTARGRGIAFDAKETANKTNFPLKNIEVHQEIFLEVFQRYGGHAFFLIECKTLAKVFRLEIDALQGFKRQEERKSIPFDWLEKNCQSITQRNGFVLDYLQGYY